MIVYLVTTGIYQVRGVFSTMEKAKAFANIFEDDNDIEACVIDRTDLCIDKEYPFCVRFSGNDQYVYFDEDDVDRCKQKAMYFNDRHNCDNDCGTYSIYVYAKDRESAVKIAKERHMQFLALNTYRNCKYINFVTKEEIK